MDEIMFVVETLICLIAVASIVTHIFSSRTGLFPGILGLPVVEPVDAASMAQHRLWWRRGFCCRFDRRSWRSKE